MKASAGWSVGVPAHPGGPKPLPGERDHFKFKFFLQSSFMLCSSSGKGHPDAS